MRFAHPKKYILRDLSSSAIFILKTCPLAHAPPNTTPRTLQHICIHTASCAELRTQSPCESQSPPTYKYHVSPVQNYLNQSLPNQMKLAAAESSYYRQVLARELAKNGRGSSRNLNILHISARRISDQIRPTFTVVQQTDAFAIGPLSHLIYKTRPPALIFFPPPPLFLLLFPLPISSHPLSL